MSSYLVNLEFDGPVTLNSVKLKKAGNAEQKVIATVLAFEASADSHFLASLWRTDIARIEKALKTLMYGSGNIYRTELGEIRLSRANKFTDHHAELHLDNHVYSMKFVTVGKFAIKGENGVPRLHFEMEAEPEMSDVGGLAEGMISSDAMLIVTPPSQQDLMGREPPQEHEEEDSDNE